MIRHIVLLTLNDDITDDARSSYVAAVRQMCAAAPEIVSWSFGENRGQGPNHHDFALVADFPDWEAFRSYIDSPAHRDYVQTHAKPNVARLAAIQHDL